VTGLAADCACLDRSDLDHTSSIRTFTEENTSVYFAGELKYAYLRS